MNQDATMEPSLDDSTWFVVDGFDPGDCFTVFALLPAEPGEPEYDRMWRSFEYARENGPMVSISSEVVDVLLRKTLEERFDVKIPANRDSMNPCAMHGQSPSFDWYGENAYAPKDIKAMVDNLATMESPFATRMAELLPKVIEEAKANGTEVVFSGP